MPRAASVPYGEGIPSVAPEVSSPIGPMNVRAGAESFGGQVGQAEEKFGATAEHASDQMFDFAIQSARMATEAKANDTIANSWAPAVAKLSGQYQETQGLDAVRGLEPFQKSLTDLHNQYLANATSPYEKQILGNYMSRHIAQELDTAQRHQDQQMTAFEDKSSAAFTDTLSNNVVSNYNNPEVVAQTKQQMDGQIAKHLIDRGADPTTDQGKQIIDEAQRKAWGTTAENVVKRALANGDVTTASAFYNANKDTIDGTHRLAIDTALHSENMRQFGADAAKALLSGNPIPDTPAGTPAQVKSIVANVAQSSGIDPSHALTVASIESNFGQNVGKRGDIGQTGKPAETLEDQAKNMTDELKKSETVASNALGRAADPWEQYVCYQQGAAGGPALLNAAKDDPTAKAVDVLSPLYKNPRDALSAVVNNGGNASMTASQFLDFIKNNYEAHANRAQMSFPVSSSAPAQTPIPDGDNIVKQPSPPSIGDAITSPHETGGIAMQQGATPVQRLLEMDKVYPDALMRANAIPNLDQREAAVKGLEQQHQLYQAAASAYTAGLMNQAQKLAVDPKFTSMDQVPPELSAALISDHPQTLAYLETRANYNLEHGSGLVTKDMREYGNGFYDLFKAIHAPDGSPDKVNSVTQLQEHVGKDGDLTIAGYDRLVKELSDKRTPEGESEAKMREESFKVVKNMLSGENELLHIKDPKGEEIYAHAMPMMYKALEDGKANHIPIGELYDPNSKNWIGNSVRGLKRTTAQMTADMLNDNSGAAPNEADTSTPQGLVQAVQNGKMTRADGEALALKNGWIRASSSGPSVPMAQ